MKRGKRRKRMKKKKDSHTAAAPPPDTPSCPKPGRPVGAAPSQGPVPACVAVSGSRRPFRLSSHGFKKHNTRRNSNNRSCVLSPR